MLQNKFVREDGSVIDSSLIISCRYTDDVNSQTNLTVGCTTASTVEVELRNPSAQIAVGEKLTYYQIEDGTENLVGIFYAEAPTMTSKVSSQFTAYDSLAKLETDFSEWLSNNQSRFPMTVRALTEFACNVAGVTLSSGTFANETIEVPAFYAERVTARQIISWVAQLAGCFARCDTTGTIEFAWYQSSDTTISGVSQTTTFRYFQDSLSKKKLSDRFNSACAIQARSR